MAKNQELYEDGDRDAAEAIAGLAGGTPQEALDLILDARRKERGL